MDILKKLKEFFVLERNVLIVSLIGFVWSGLLALWEPFLPKFYEDLGAPIIVVGALVSLTTAVESFGGLVGGHLTDKFGRKKIMLISGYLALLSIFIYFFSSSWAQLILPIIILAVATKSFSISRMVTVADSLPSRKRATGFSTYYILASMSAIFMAPAGGWLVQNYGMLGGVKIGLGLTVLVGLLIFTLCFLFIRETLKQKTAKRRIGKAKATLKFLKEIPRSVKIFMTAMIVYYFGASIPATFIIFYLLDKVGITPFEFSILLAVQMAVSLIAILFGGKFSDKSGRKTFILLEISLSAITILLLIFARNFWYLVIIFALGAMAAVGLPSINAYIADMIPLRKRARILGLMDSFSSIGILGPIIGAVLYSIFPASVFIAASAIYFLSFFLILKFVKE